MTQNAKSIQELINANISKTDSPSGKPEKVRFMLELDPPVRERLRTLAEKIHCPQIALASELFEMSLNKAQEAYDAAIAEKAAKAAAAKTPATK